MTRKIIPLLPVLSIFSIFIYCSDEPQQLFETSIRNGIPHITNHSPQFESAQFVELKKMYSIPAYGETENGETYEISFITAMDVDEDENLYILGSREGTITVFDKNGKHLRTFGGQGQGPKELTNAGIFIYEDGLLYIVEGFSGLKIWDKYGEYVNNLKVPRTNYTVLLKSDNWYFTAANFIPDINNPNWILKFNRYSKDMLNFTEILSQEYNRYNDLFFGTFSAFSVDTSSNFYFLEDQSDYTMIKYNESGEPLLSFSRDYDTIRYSQEAVDKYSNMFSAALESGDISALPDYPQTIRKSLIDSHGYIWIVSGETAQDNNNPDFQSTVDIFDTEGKWLQSFKSTAVTLRSIFRNDRLYSPSLYNDRVEQFIDVFEIIYK